MPCTQTLTSSSSIFIHFFSTFLYSGYCRPTKSALINNQIEVSHQVTIHMVVEVKKEKNKKERERKKKEHKLKTYIYMLYTSCMYRMTHTHDSGVLAHK